jgi:magnesium transporter
MTGFARRIISKISMILIQECVLKKVMSIESVTNNGLTWIYIHKPTRESMNIISKRYRFHELNIEDSLSKVQIPKIDRYEDHIFMILHFPTKEEKDEYNSSPRIRQLSIFAGADYLVTVHQGDLKPLIDMFQLCNIYQQQRDTIMGKSSGYLLHSIIDALVDDLFHILKKVVGNIHDIEDNVFDERLAVAKEISLLRREITILRRTIFPLRRIVSLVTRLVQKFSEEDLTLYYDDVNDHIDTVIEILEESRETIEIYKDTDFMLSTEKINKILGILTILFTLSIPATVIGTFYGMNIELPGGREISSLHFFGSYTTFIVLMFLSIISALFMLWYFRRLGWIRFVR